MLTDTATNQSQNSVIAKSIENKVHKLFRKEVPRCNHKKIEKEEGAEITQQNGRKTSVERQAAIKGETELAKRTAHKKIDVIKDNIFMKLVVVPVKRQIR